MTGSPSGTSEGFNHTVELLKVGDMGLPDSPPILYRHPVIDDMIEEGYDRDGVQGPFYDAV